MSVRATNGRPRYRPDLGIGLALLALHLLTLTRLPFAEPAPTVDPGQAGLRINPNHAHLHELALLPGIGPVRAQRIIAFRQNQSADLAFRSADDLAAVHGIGPATVAKISPFLCFDPPPSASPARQP
jgi:competence ComEA-like helix-hairpin-helix protein